MDRANKGETVLIIAPNELSFTNIINEVKRARLVEDPGRGGVLRITLDPEEVPSLPAPDHIILADLDLFERERLSEFLSALEPLLNCKSVLGTVAGGKQRIIPASHFFRIPNQREQLFLYLQKKKKEPAIMHNYVAIGRVLPLRGVSLARAAEGCPNRVALSPTTTPAGIQYTIVPDKLLEEDVIENGLVFFTRAEAEQLMERGAILLLPYTVLDDLYVEEGVGSLADYLAEYTNPLYDHRTLANFLANEIELWEEEGAIEVRDLVLDLSQYRYRETEMSAGKHIDVLQDTLNEGVGRAKMMGKQEEAARALMECLSKINKELPEDSAFSRNVNDIINTIMAGGDPTPLIQKMATELKKPATFMSLGKNAVSIIGLAIGTFAILNKLKNVDWAKVSGVLKQTASSLNPETADVVEPEVMGVDDVESQAADA